MEAIDTKVIGEILPQIDPERENGGGEHIEPRVGMGATFRVWTDTHACTIIEIRRNGKELVLQRDSAKLLNGVNSGEKDALTFTPGGFVGHVDGQQRFVYSRNSNGEIIRVSKRVWKDNKGVMHVRWKTVGSPRREPGGEATLGIRSEHYDYNF